MIVLNVVVIPDTLEPSYPYKYDVSSYEDELFEEEIKNVMKQLDQNALEPLKQPSIEDM